MDNKQTESELRYIPIDETVQNNPNIQIRIWDEQRSREVGYEGELEFKNVKVTVPFYNSRRVISQDPSDFKETAPQVSWQNRLIFVSLVQIIKISMSPKLKSKWSQMEKEIDLKDLTNADSIRQLIAQLKNGKDQYILRDNGQRQAALLSLDDLELLKQAQQNKQKAWVRLFQNMEKVRARNPDVSEQQVHADVKAAIQAIRQQQT